jgi:threonine aldolase
MPDDDAAPPAEDTAPVRDWVAVRGAAPRRLAGGLPDERRPHAVLTRLASMVSPDDEPDYYGELPPISDLEQRVAELLGKDAAVFMPSGTMAQQIALRIWCDRTSLRTVAFHPTSHLELHEHRAYERLHGLQARLVGSPHDIVRLSDLDELDERIAVLLLELPQREIGGRLPEWDELTAQAAWAREHEVRLHMDGARLWECAPYYGRSYAEISALFDTVYVSLYKGVAGIAGCCLAGPADVVDDARVWRSRHGGTLFAMYPYVLAAQHGLDTRLDRVPAYYAKAREIADALRDHARIEVVPDPPQTPMMHLLLRTDPDAFLERALDLAEQTGVWAFPRPRPTTSPSWHKVELTVGESTLGFDTDEITGLLDRLLGD